MNTQEIVKVYQDFMGWIEDSFRYSGATIFEDRKGLWQQPNKKLDKKTSNALNTAYLLDKKENIMKKELIEKLKHNERAFGLLSKEEQYYLRKIGRKNCQLYAPSNYWADWRNLDEDGQFCADMAYRIKPDYEPEPEIEKREIYEDEGELVFETHTQILHLTNAFYKTNFANKFEYGDGTKSEWFWRDNIVTGKAEHAKYVLFYTNGRD